MNTYALRDVFKFIIGIEEQGNAFYKLVAVSLSTRSLKDLFTYLAKQEVKHAKVFLKLYEKHAEKNAVFSASEELSEFLDTLTRGLFFPDLAEVRDALKNKKEAASAMVKIAMDVELNTILFYRQINELMASPEIKSVIDEVIGEEENHLARLKRARLDVDPLYAVLRYGKFF